MMGIRSAEVSTRKLAIAADHAGAALKAALLKELQTIAADWEGIDLGGDGSDLTDDYPDASRAVAELMREQRVSSVLLVEQDHLFGLVADRDLRNRAIAAGLDTALLEQPNLRIRYAWAPAQTPGQTPGQTPARTPGQPPGRAFARALRLAVPLVAMLACGESGLGPVTGGRRKVGSRVSVASKPGTWRAARCRASRAMSRVFCTARMRSSTPV